MQPAVTLLSSLLKPLSAKFFMFQYWRREMLLLQERPPTFYHFLFSLRDLEQLTHLTIPQTNSFLIVKDSKALDREFCKEGVLDWDLLFSAYHQGCTIIINQLDQFFPKLQMFATTMTKIFKNGTNLNLYLTPEGAQGLGPHYDKHQVLVLQIEGSKNWKVYQHIQDIYPELGHEDCMEMLPIVPRQDLTTPQHQFQLKAGDLLYLPGGFVHEASTEDDFSLHLSLGIH